MNDIVSSCSIFSTDKTLNERFTPKEPRCMFIINSGYPKSCENIDLNRRITIDNPNNLKINQRFSFYRDRNVEGNGILDKGNNKACERKLFEFSNSGRVSVVKESRKLETEVVEHFSGYPDKFVKWSPTIQNNIQSVVFSCDNSSYVRQSYKLKGSSIRQRKFTKDLDKELGKYMRGAKNKTVQDDDFLFEGNGINRPSIVTPSRRRTRQVVEPFGGHPNIVMKWSPTIQSNSSNLKNIQSVEFSRDNVQQFSYKWGKGSYNRRRKVTKEYLDNELDKYILEAENGTVLADDSFVEGNSRNRSNNIVRHSRRLARQVEHFGVYPNKVYKWRPKYVNSFYVRQSPYKWRKGSSIRQRKTTKEDLDKELDKYMLEAKNKTLQDADPFAEINDTNRPSIMTQSRRLTGQAVENFGECPNKVVRWCPMIQSKSINLRNNQPLMFSYDNCSNVRHSPYKWRKGSSNRQRKVTKEYLDEELDKYMIEVKNKTVQDADSFVEGRKIIKWCPMIQKASSNVEPVVYSPFSNSSYFWQYPYEWRKGSSMRKINKEDLDRELDEYVSEVKNDLKNDEPVVYSPFSHDNSSNFCQSLNNWRQSPPKRRRDMTREDLDDEIDEYMAKVGNKMVQESDSFVEEYVREIEKYLNEYDDDEFDLVYQ